MIWLALGCSSEEPAKNNAGVEDPPERVHPSERGPYGVGATTLFVDDDRVSRDPDDNGELQTLKVEVWYPAVDPGTEPDFYPEIAIQSGSWRDSEVDVRGAPYPVVFFSHGFGGIRYQNAFMAEHLTSHGFAVVAVDHPHHTLMDLNQSLTGMVLVDRPGDVTRAFDAVVDSDYGDVVDGDRFVMSGHSFGGLTTLIVAGGELDKDYGLDWCEEHDPAGCDFIVEGTEIGDTSLAVADPRAIAAVDISPAGWYAFGENGLDDLVPTMVIAGEADQDLPYDEEGRPLMDALGTPKTLVTLSKVGHWGPTNLCEVIPPSIFEECEGEEAGWRPFEEVHSIINTLVTDWAGHHLVDDWPYSDAIAAPYWKSDPDVLLETEP